MELDVRQIPPRERHPRIFALFDRLMPGEGFVLVNDHDPKPLYYQFQAERPGQVDWSYLEEGPEVWRVGKEGEGRAAALTEADWEDFQAEVFVEENLEPPLPMMRVLEALATLKPGEKLLVHHVRRPIHLLARLEEEGTPTPSGT